MPNPCTWYSVDYTTATGPESYVPHNGFAAAVAALPSSNEMAVVWGSVDDDWNSSSNAAVVSVFTTPAVVPAGFFVWAITLPTLPGVDSSVAPVSTPQLALAEAQLSQFLPEGFCVEPSITSTPNALINAVKCLRCYPISELKKMQILLACIWGGGAVPGESSFLIQSENSDYIILDDGGRIIIN